MMKTIWNSSIAMSNSPTGCPLPGTAITYIIIKTTVPPIPTKYHGLLHLLMTGITQNSWARPDTIKNIVRSTGISVKYMGTIARCSTPAINVDAAAA